MKSVYIAGDQLCQVQVEEPAVLVVALYLRDIAGLRPALAQELPPLEPPIDRWPVWARRPPTGWTPPVPARTRLVDPGQADEEWLRWWNQLLRNDSTIAAPIPHPPRFAEVRHLPALRLLLQRFYDDAIRWVEALSDDPRSHRQLDAPHRGLTALINDLRCDPDRIPRGFRLRLTVIPVRTKHAWPLTEDHVLVTRALIADTDNALDWLTPRIRKLAWREGHVSLRW